MDKRLSMTSDDHKGPYVTIFKKVVHVGLFGTLEACSSVLVACCLEALTAHDFVLKPHLLPKWNCPQGS